MEEPAPLPTAKSERQSIPGRKKTEPTPIPSRRQVVGSLAEGEMWRPCAAEAIAGLASLIIPGGGQAIQGRMLAAFFALAFACVPWALFWITFLSGSGDLQILGAVFLLAALIVHLVAASFAAGYYRFFC